MDFDMSFTAEQEREREAFRPEVRTWTEQKARAIVLPVDPEDLTQEQFEVNRRFLRDLGQQGWYAPTWPREFGGGGMEAHIASVIREELERAIPHIENLHPPGDIGGSAAGALWEVGTDEQKASFLPPVLRGEVITWELYTEPEAGSDLPALTSRAERDGDHYVISGTKTLVGGHFGADWLFYLAITNPNAPRRENLSAFLVPADSPGITMTDLDMIAGSKKRTMIFDGVRVPASHMIGREGDGWRAFSSGLFGALTVGIGPYMDRDMRVFDTLLSHCREEPSTPAGPLSRAALAQAYVEAQVQRLLRLRNDWMVESGKDITYEGAQVALGRKTFDLALGETVHKILGPAAMLRGDGAPLYGELEYFHRYAILMAHPGGTVEIQKLRMFRGMEAAAPA
jgi:alkylation response protein AidB-like acyl-CoA dehydrogenase